MFHIFFVFFFAKLLPKVNDRDSMPLYDKKETNQKKKKNPETKSYSFPPYKSGTLCVGVW